MEKKRLLTLIGSVCLILVLAGLSFMAACAPKPAAPPAPAPAPPAPALPKVIELKFANYFPPPSRQSTLLEEFCREVEKRTGGRVKFDYYPGGSLLTAPAMFDGIVKGVADIGYCHIDYTPGRMPVTEAITALTLGYPSAWVDAHVANDFYNEFKPKEWDEVKLLSLHANEPKVIYTKKPVRKLEDLKGLTIRAPGRAGDIVKALGATPAPTPTAEMYDAIAKGVLDGAFLPWETLKTFKTAEVVKYVTVSWQVGSTDCFYVVMNKSSYDKLKAVPDVKEIFDTVCGEYKERLALMWNLIDFEGMAYAQEKGVEFIELSPEEAARWQKAAEPVTENYVKAMVGKGYSEAEVRGWIKFLRERIDYWTKQQILWRIPSVTGPEEMRP